MRSHDLNLSTEISAIIKLWYVTVRCERENGKPTLTKPDRTTKRPKMATLKREMLFTGMNLLPLIVCEPYRYVHNSSCARQRITNCNCQEDLKTSSSLTLGTWDKRQQPCRSHFHFICIKGDQRACIWTIQSIQLSLREDILEEESVGDHEDDEEREEEGSVGEGLDQPEDGQAS